ncbi:MAG TPA: hypothetical protein VGF29_16390 [Hyphomicrobiaceae bacterium]|jgi:hypothetical protein
MRGSHTLTAGDITGGAVGDWLVTGWFTPNYRPLAEKFATNLAQYHAPFHLWAKSKAASGWNTWRKSSVVMETMDAYPGKTIILMDTDCIVRGDLAPMADFAGDVSLTLKARRMRLIQGFHKRLTLKTSSRVVVFRPTAGARAFAQEWERLLQSATYEGDEVSMVMAFLRRPDISYYHLDSRFAGDEVGNTVPDAVISHYGAHGRTKSSHLGNALKEIERRYFRSGRSQAAKRAWR